MSDDIGWSHSDSPDIPLLLAQLEDDELFDIVFNSLFDYGRNERESKSNPNFDAVPSPARLAPAVVPVRASDMRISRPQARRPVTSTNVRVRAPEGPNVLHATQATVVPTAATQKVSSSKSSKVTDFGGIKSSSASLFPSSWETAEQKLANTIQAISSIERQNEIARATREAILEEEVAENWRKYKGRKRARYLDQMRRAEIYEATRELIDEEDRLRREEEDVVDTRGVPLWQTAEFSHPVPDRVARERLEEKRSRFREHHERLRHYDDETERQHREFPAINAAIRERNLVRQARRDRGEDLGSDVDEIEMTPRKKRTKKFT